MRGLTTPRCRLKLAFFNGPIVHLVRHSLNFCSWKDRKAVAAGLREVYGADTAETAWDALEAFDDEWGRQYPSIAQAWLRIPWKMGACSTRSWARIPRHRGQPFHASGSLADIVMELGLTCWVKRI